MDKSDRKPEINFPRYPHTKWPYHRRDVPSAASNPSDAKPSSHITFDRKPVTPFISPAPPNPNAFANRAASVSSLARLGQLTQTAPPHSGALSTQHSSNNFPAPIGPAPTLTFTPHRNASDDNAATSGNAIPPSGQPTPPTSATIAPVDEHSVIKPQHDLLQTEIKRLTEIIRRKDHQIAAMTQDKHSIISTNRVPQALNARLLSEQAVTKSLEEWNTQQWKQACSSTSTSAGDRENYELEDIKCRLNVALACHASTLAGKTLAEAESEWEKKKADWMVEDVRKAKEKADFFKDKWQHAAEKDLGLRTELVQARRRVSEEADTDTRVRLDSEQWKGKATKFGSKK